MGSQKYCPLNNAETLCRGCSDLLLQFGTQATERRVRGKRRRVRGHKGVQALLLELVSTEGFCQFEYIADMALPSTQRCVQHGLTYLLQGVEPDGAGGPHDLPGIADLWMQWGWLPPFQTHLRVTGLLSWL